MLVHYIDDILQTGPAEREVANAMDVLVNVAGPVSQRFRDPVHDVIFSGPGS